jgi:hypothetical protein
MLRHDAHRSTVAIGRLICDAQFLTRKHFNLRLSGNVDSRRLGFDDHFGSNGEISMDFTIFIPCPPSR